MIKIRKSLEADLPDIYKIQRDAFGQEEEADLTRMIMSDETASPRVSMILFNNEVAAGHILFSRCSIEGVSRNSEAYILAPLAVVPDFQNKGFGGELIKSGLEELEKTDAALVFVLGDPRYYRKYGFAPARMHGLEPPYRLPAAWADAWMVQELKIGALENNSGKVRCCNALSDEKYWRE